MYDSLRLTDFTHMPKNCLLSTHSPYSGVNMNAILRTITLLSFATFSAQAAAVSNSQVFAFAEANYTSFFNGTGQDGTYEQYNYRFYPATGNYLAVGNDGGIYALGPFTGNQILYVGPLTDFTPAITSWESSQSGSGSGSSTSCGTAPAGMTYSQSGNTINISTNGCIALPTNGACNPASPTATGLNVLMNVSPNSTFAMSGLSFNIPGMADPFDSVGSSLAAATVCYRNAPSELADQTINANVCYDITSAMGSSLSAYTADPTLSSYITVSNPVTISSNMTITHQTVSDCSTSGASVIYDALTGQTLVKQANGSYQ